MRQGAPSDTLHHHWRSVFRAAGVALCGLLGATSAWSQAEAPPANPSAALRAEARAHEHGEGVPKNPAKASELYCQAAHKGDAEAQFDLGWMYANGRGIPRDDALAAYFFALAAQQGHPQAASMLRYVGDPVTQIPPCMQEQAKPETVEIDVVLPEHPGQAKIFELVHLLAPEYGVSPRLALSVIRAESNFNPGALSNKNAQGLMQLIPETSLRFNVRKPFDPEQNIRGGLAYLRWLLAYFKGDVALVAAAYNAGEGAVNRFRGIPPFAETRGYVKRIMESFKKDEHPYDPAVTAPSPEIVRIRNRKLM